MHTCIPTYMHTYIHTYIISLLIFDVKLCYLSNTIIGGGDRGREKNVRNRIAIFTTINRIAIFTAINRIAIFTTINRIAMFTTINSYSLRGEAAGEGGALRLGRLE